MCPIASYTRQDRLRDGTPVQIRALRPDDEAAMLAALEQASMRSLQRRFFTPKRHFSERERTFFMEVDFKTHVALVACVDDAGRSVIVGGGRYIVSEPGCAELAFVVIDSWQGRGIGAMLAHDLVALAREAGLKELIADVLAENTAMRRVFDKLGFKPAARLDPETVHLRLMLS
ncbi:GNAT family N-acetyltransferase [Bradyrhizobium liaoningense]|uniref:GNAT family N-acetyltransferase n=1 Tax=Bradyrhizobium liaoningense TaxID=43992 RepID=UPI001BAD6E53|nr:GNAT family N-acetyltransferase [Bradyrhizobium liaoningense]MBR0841144.1 GNAT family N-acetyltransferase [Bradyrhizobium liaoningense]MBR0853173.1 GNAT family N-acetyltransferase [Bradyrhizobium liaoningense]